MVDEKPPDDTPLDYQLFGIQGPRALPTSNIKLFGADQSERKIIDTALLEKRFSKEMTELSASKREFSFSVEIGSMIAIIGNLQLALRHPGNSGPSAQLARAFILDCKTALADYPGICGLIDKGFDNRFDL